MNDDITEPRADLDANLFSLLFWQVDGGGPADRYLQPRVHPDFAFAEDLRPELASTGMAVDHGRLTSG